MIVEISNKKPLRHSLLVLFSFFSFFLSTIGCDSFTQSEATLVMSLDSVQGTKSHQKISKYETDISELSKFQLEVIDSEEKLLASETFSLEQESISLQVPAGETLIVNGRAFADSVLRYEGQTRISPLSSGEKSTLTFFLYDVDAQPVQIDIGISGKPANGASTGSRFSLSRDYVLFSSEASNLVEGDENNVSDLFLRDLSSDSIVSLHSSSEGILASSNTSNLIESDISADGRYVVFSSSASNLVDNDTNEVTDVFLKDTSTGKTRRISVTQEGVEVDTASYQPQISNDGRFVLFHSEATVYLYSTGYHMS